MNIGDTPRAAESHRAPLDEQELDPNPITQFEAWFHQALVAGTHEPTTMALATADAEGRPSVRMVLLKGVSARGFVFFTHYDSRKAQELAANPWAALAFYWPEVHRQVRIEGPVKRLSEVESDAYFRTRPRGSQLSVWASHQSVVIGGRAELEEQMTEAARRFEGQEVPRPAYWGGYCLRPVVIEFWQGRDDRLHDRMHYRRVEDGTWVMERLAP